MSRARRRAAAVRRDTWADRHLHRVAKATRRWGWNVGWARAFPGSYVTSTLADTVTEYGAARDLAVDVTAFMLERQRTAARPGAAEHWRVERAALAARVRAVDPDDPAAVAALRAELRQLHHLLRPADRPEE